MSFEDRDLQPARAMDVGALEDLGARWERARRAALRTVAGRVEAESDEALAVRAFEVDAREASRLAFDHGVTLGKGFVRSFGPVAFHQLPETLSRLPGPCLRGQWEPHPREAAFVLERPSCGGCASVCDAWREALDGLVVGVTGEGRATRHRSGGHGDGTCVDVLYRDPESRLRFGFIPDGMRDGLEAITKFLNGMKGTHLEFRGVSEGVLLYELAVEGCGGTEAVTKLLARSVTARWPALTLRDVSPRSPFSTEAA